MPLQFCIRKRLWTKGQLCEVGLKVDPSRYRNYPTFPQVKTIKTSDVKETTKFTGRLTLNNQK